MNTLLQKVGSVLIGVLISLHVWAPVAPVIPQTPTQNVGAYNPTGGGTYRLRSSIGISDTTISLSSFKEPISGIPYTMTYLNTTVGYGTIEPLSTTRKEFVSFTGITQNSDGSATLTGVSRGMSFSYPYTASSTLVLAHSGQSIFILSDSPEHFSEYAVKRNDETVTGAWSFPEPSAPANPATKNYVDTTVSGGNISTNKITVTGTAGETVSAGQILYLSRFDGQWYKASANLASTSIATLLGVAQGAGTVGVSISGGVLLTGLDTNQKVMTAGRQIYLSGTAGATSTSPGTFYKVVGQARTATDLYFNPWADGSFATSTSATSTTAVLTVTASTTTALLRATATSTLATTTENGINLTDVGKSVQFLTSTGTWTKPAGVTRIKLTVIGGGGGGGGSNASNVSAGGGSAGVCVAYVDVTGTTTVNYIIGAKGNGGAVGAVGTAGTVSRFSTYCVSNPGSGAPSGLNASGANGGTASGGDINLPGHTGGDAPVAFGTQTLSGAGANTPLGWGLGGLGVKDDAGGQAATGYGAGGSGGASSQAGGDGVPGAIIIEY